MKRLVTDNRVLIIPEYRSDLILVISIFHSPLLLMPRAPSKWFSSPCAVLVTHTKLPIYDAAKHALEQGALKRCNRVDAHALCGSMIHEREHNSRFWRFNETRSRVRNWKYIKKCTKYIFFSARFIETSLI